MSMLDTTLAPRPAPLPRAEARQLALRRLSFVAPSVALAATIGVASVAVLRQGPHEWFDWVLAVPFCVAMAWECLVVWQLVLGFLQWLRGPEGWSRVERLAEAVPPAPSGLSRTAIVIPIYEEDVATVFAAIAIMRRSLARLGPCDDLELHVLSDTQSTERIAAEAEAVREAARDPTGPRLSYRRRARNTGRKAGNIGDFLERQGDRFDFAVVLDADSLMTGSAIRRLIRTMEASPRIGLLQTVSYAAGRTTLFARMQQFAIRLYAPLALHGLHYWQGPEGSYWGHNAIVRIAPFRAHCALPVLQGRPPLGGEILCHDVVEGALLARAGWEVYLLPDFEGTWEEMPTNVLDLLARERRWCQGNLQHLRLLAWPGLKAASRAHLAFGIGGYLVVPVWWAFAIGGALRVLLAPDGAYGVLAYGLSEPGAAASLLATCSLALLVVPRLLSLIRALAPRASRRSFGGGVRLLVGAAVEQIYAILLGPVLALACATFVADILGGRNAGWSRQVRAERRVGFGEALRWHALQTVVGVCLLLAAARAGGWYGLVTLPSALGLALSPLTTALSSRQDLGRWSRRLGLFLTSDDVTTAPELRELHGSEQARA